MISDSSHRLDCKMTEMVSDAARETLWLFLLLTFLISSSSKIFTRAFSANRPVISALDSWSCIWNHQVAVDLFVCFSEFASLPVIHGHRAMCGSINRFPTQYNLHMMGFVTNKFQWVYCELKGVEQAAEKLGQKRNVIHVDDFQPQILQRINTE